MKSVLQTQMDTAPNQKTVLETTLLYYIKDKIINFYFMQKNSYLYDIGCKLVKKTILSDWMNHHREAKKRRS